MRAGIERARVTLALASPEAARKVIHRLLAAYRHDPGLVVARAPLVASEIECVAAGGEHCRFVMAPPSRIEEHLSRQLGGAVRGSRRRAAGGTPPSIPEFFQRKRMEDELRQSHESLDRRVAERTAELLQANERLQREIIERKRAEEARAEFLSVAAHELKTPMTSLRGFAQVLLSQLDRGQTPAPARLAQALGALDRQTEKLARLVSQLLDVSRLEAGHLLLDPQPTDIVGIVESVAEGARARTSRHRIEETATNEPAPSAIKASDDPVWHRRPYPP